MLMAGCGGSSGGGTGTGGTGGGNNSTTVTVTFTGATPSAVATKVGSGSFTAATLTGGNLTLSLPSGTTNFGVAYVCPPFAVTSYQETVQSIVEASTLDGTSFSVSCGTASNTSATGTLTGTLDASAISGVSYVGIFANNGPNSGGMDRGPIYGNSASGSFSFPAPTGVDRVWMLAFGPVGGTTGLLAAKNFSSQTVPGALNGGNTVVLGAADQTTLEPITYNSVPAGYSAPEVDAGYNTAGGAGFLITSGSIAEYQALPAGAMESGDYYSFSAFSQSGSGEVVVDSTATSGGPLSVTFPSAWTYAGPAAAKWPSFDIEYTGFSGTTGVCDGLNVNWYASSTVWDVVTLTATGNYLNGSTTVAIPDLSGLPGFVAAPASGTGVGWGASVSQGTSTCIPPTPLNSTTKMVISGGRYTVP